MFLIADMNHDSVLFRCFSSRTQLLCLLAPCHSLLEHLNIEKPSSILSAMPLLSLTGLLLGYCSTRSGWETGPGSCKGTSYQMNVCAIDDNKSEWLLKVEWWNGSSQEQKLKSWLLLNQKFQHNSQVPKKRDFDTKARINNSIPPYSFLLKWNQVVLTLTAY